MFALRRGLLAAVVASAGIVGAAPPAHAADPVAIGRCDSGTYDVEIHLGSGRCVLLNYPW